MMNKREPVQTVLAGGYIATLLDSLRVASRGYRLPQFEKSDYECLWELIANATKIRVTVNADVAEKLCAKYRESPCK